MVLIRRTAWLLLCLSATLSHAEEAATSAKIIEPPEAVKTLITSRCQPCHFELRIKPSLLLNTHKWFRLSGKDFEIERRVFLEAPPHSMPMGALLDEDERMLLQSWFGQLHKEL